MKRRALLFAVAMVGAGRGLVACGGSGGGAPPAGGPPPSPSPTPTPAPAPTPAPVPPPPTALVWDVDPPPTLLAGAIPIIYDLAPTLPAQIQRGGTFGVAASGAPLPVGVTLSPLGILLATDVAGIGATNGVIFTYTEPA